MFSLFNAIPSFVGHVLPKRSLVGLVVWVSWHINHYGLFNAKSIYIYELYMICNHFHMNSPVLRKLSLLLNSCFDPFDPQYRTPTGTTTPGHSGPTTSCNCWNLWFWVGLFDKTFFNIWLIGRLIHWIDCNDVLHF